MSDYLLQESGFKIALEDGTGFVLLDDGGPPWSAELEDAARFSGTITDAARFGATVSDE